MMFSSLKESTKLVALCGELKESLSEVTETHTRIVYVCMLCVCERENMIIANEYNACSDVVHLHLKLSIFC